MQSLATYCFESVVSDVSGRLQAIDQIVDEWLTHKGAADPRAADGDFQSESGDGTGQFSRKLLETKEGSLREIELLETAHTGATFTTSVQVASVGQNIAVCVSLSAAPGKAVVAPMNLNPRCPWIVRALITRFSEWKFGNQELPVGLAFDATTPNGIASLCDALRAPGRRFPIVVVSTDQDEAVWKDLPQRLAEHLIGLADVAFVDAESSWALTDALGPQNSCYLGAVRLYWPQARRNGVFEGIVWRAQRLAASFGTDAAGMNRFVASVRRIVMSTAALTVLPPAAIREIQNAATKERFQALNAAERERELSSIVDENARLSSELQEARGELARLRWKLAALEHQRDEPAESDDLDAATSPEDAPAGPTPPSSGEIRYYKKIGSGGGVDTLVPTGACNHKAGNWKPAFKGDQAEKGLLKLEGRNDWRSIAHCSACTGGGRWRVHW
ncbi:hypothetical protein H8N03_25820 [Ramlibacter sp. USB13]|uniref:Uncharacterized protein n=1 Tax=Ramlibacter cellulosilyticus TaxID=2764187 RepID=A0A923MZ66_9BURK|nr:hypothetical protein [Ramlibacter cellulosilyticus]MBC5786382.1 hypothetical protein [Ramlibacter cellulosilyticus]